jgi:hypothetical protein
MAQFDPLIIFPLMWTLIFVLAIYYKISIEILIPQFSGMNKFREKKLNSLNSFNSFNACLVAKTTNTIVL